MLLYELRNSELYDSIIERDVDLEQKLGLGLLSTRAQKRATLFGLVGARQERGVGLVYGAALAGWTYPVVWGALRALDVGGARKIGAVAGVLVGAAVVVESTASWVRRPEPLAGRGGRAGPTRLRFVSARCRSGRHSLTRRPSPSA